MARKTEAGKGKPVKRISLFRAAGDGDLERVKQALAEGADVNELRDGMSPLLTASSGSMPNLDVVRALLKAGADPNLGEVGLPLRLAASRANVELVRILLDGGADPNGRTSDGRTALMSAIGWDNAELVQLLLDAGADPDLEDARGMTAMSEAISRGERETADLLRAVTTNETSERPWRSAQSKESKVERMVKAAKAGDVEFVQRMLEEGVGVDEKASYEVTALCNAASGGGMEVIELLLARGASVNLPGQAGMTPLIEAALGAHPAAVRRLLATGADVKAKDRDGWTALHRNFGGASIMNVEVVDLLIDAGADVNVQEGVFGCTPLHLVAERGRDAAPGVAAAIIQRLIRAGADLTIKDRMNGWTPFVRAVAHGDLSMVKTMIALGADMKEIEGGKGEELAEKWGDPLVAQYLKTLA